MSYNSKPCKNNLIAIWAEPRTGSTYLVDLVVRYLEKTQCQNIFIQKERIDTVIKDFEKAYENNSCMCLRNHLEHFYLWEQYKIDNLVGEFYNIFLYRQNFFEQTVSNWIGSKTQVWATGDPNIVKTLESNIWQISESDFIDLLDRRWDQLTKNYSKINYSVSLSYEQLTFAYDDDLKILNLTNNVSIQKPTRTLKLPKKQKQIENWDKLKQIYMEKISKYSSNSFYFDENGMLYVNKK